MLIKGSQGDKLYWDVYEKLMPIELLDQIDFFYGGHWYHPVGADEKFTQDEVCNLASRALVVGDGSEVKYNNCTAKCRKFGDSYRVDFVKAEEGKELSLATYYSQDYKAVFLVFEKNGQEKDRLYIDNEGERWVTKGTYFAFRKDEIKNKLSEGEAEKGE